MSTQAICSLCGEPMPPGEEMFKFHGFSGDCPKPPLPRKVMSMFEAFSSRMKTLRMERGLSLQQLADKVPCSKTHIWEIEQGRTDNPTLATVESVAQALGTTPQYMLGFEAS